MTPDAFYFPERVHPQACLEMHMHLRTIIVRALTYFVGRGAGGRGIPLEKKKNNNIATPLLFHITGRLHIMCNM